MKIKALIFLFLMVAASLSLAKDVPYDMKANFDQAVGGFVTSIVNDSQNMSSGVGGIVNAFLLFMSFLSLSLAFKKMAYYPISLWMPAVIESLLWVSFMWAFWLMYDEALKNIFSWSEGFAIELNNQVFRMIGLPPSNDSLSLGQQLNAMFTTMTSEELSIWAFFGNLNKVIENFLFFLALGLIKVMVFFLTSYSFWFYEFAKISGIFFVGFMALKATRKIFINWIGIMFTAFFFNLYSKILLCMMLLYFYGIMKAKVVNGGLFIGVVGEADLLISIIYMIMGVIFCFSVTKLVAPMALAVASACASGSLVSGVANAATGRALRAHKTNKKIQDKLYSSQSTQKNSSKGRPNTISSGPNGQ